MPDTYELVDEVGFQSLYCEHADAVFTFALRRLPAGDAEDLVADVFLVAWRRRADLPADARPWLLGVARRVLANRRRGRQRADALIARLARERAVATGGGWDDSGELDLGLLEALLSLSEADQEVLMLSAWEGLSSSQLASVLGVSAGAVAARLFRARRRLARAIAHHENDDHVGTTTSPLAEAHDA
jgi:RNA polymerase sigma-70 factor (ECF subfamily)